MADDGVSFCELMRRVHEGSDDAAWELVERYGDAIRRGSPPHVERAAAFQVRLAGFRSVGVELGSSVRWGDSRNSDRPEELAAYLVKMARNKVGMETRKRLLTEKYNVNRECLVAGCRRLGAQGVVRPAVRPAGRGDRP